MRNDALLNNLFHFFFKYLAEHFDNQKFQETKKVELFRPPNSYILYCHGECCLSTLYLKEMAWKIRYGKY